MKYIFTVLLSSISLLSCASPKVASEHSSTDSARSRSSVYSQRMVNNSAMKTFLSNKKEQQLATAHWDYVPGLVAYSVLKTWQQYPDKTAYYDIVKAYADHCLKGQDTLAVGESNIDDLAAGKIFATLYTTELGKGNYADAERYKKCFTYLRNKLKYKHARIDASLPGTGGFFHKAQYPNQMWLDGLYMGTAMYAEWQATLGATLGEKDNNDSWADIASQFITLHKYTYDREKQLNYHAWSADPSDANSFWANKSGEYTGCSPEFWGRGVGWYFAALVDVLELMPRNHANYKELAAITNQVAAGLARHQDKESGCWYQLLQYDATTKGDGVGDLKNGKTYNQCDQANYLESSASSMFTYAFYKGIRIGVLSKDAYLPIAQKAYNGLLTNFLIPNLDNSIVIGSSCASAGLGPVKNQSRTGTVNYYLCGEDVAITRNEGKAIGSFIMASLEHELVP